MRGTLRRAFRKFRRLGIIPAYAGNTTRCIGQVDLLRDHPRVCGEHYINSTTINGLLGSSPRMRGTHMFGIGGAGGKGIIPAYAGNTSTPSPHCYDTWDHPRVCGEHLLMASVSLKYSGSSPRMRGTPLRVMKYGQPSGIIPAYAGNTYVRYRRCRW